VRLRSPAPMTVRDASGQIRIRGEAAGTLVVDATAARSGARAAVVLEIDLAAGAQLEARLDDRTLTAERMFVGPFALALLEGPRVNVDATTWDALQASGAPPRDAPGFYVWGEGTPRGTLPPTPAVDSGPIVTPVHDRDVTKILKGWGYIQGSEKTTTTPR
jgi:hypothetical protein